MAPIMPANVPLAGGSRDGIARCAAIRFRPMRYVSVACWLGAATSSTGEEPIWRCCLGKPTQPDTTHRFSFPFPLLPFSEQSRDWGGDAQQARGDLYAAALLLFAAGCCGEL